MKVRRVESRLVEVVCEAPACQPRQRTPGAFAEILRPLMESEPVEVFALLTLDSKHMVTGYVEISRGTISTSLVHPREVFGPALRMGAASILVAHNHPSGDPKPSRQDEEVTVRLVEAGKLLGVLVIDHLIIGADGAFVSFNELGLI